jgi:hypothetical protein
MISLNLPLWLCLVLLVGIVALVSGASLLAYRYYTRPVTQSVAVGSIGIATVLAAAWKFLGIGNPATSEGPLLSMPSRAGFGASAQRLSCQKLKKRLTTFSRRNAPNPPVATRARWMTLH